MHHPIEVVPAIELSSVDDSGDDLHILGYRIDHTSDDLLAILAILRDDRAARIDGMAARLREHGFALADEPLEERKLAGRPIGRPHLATAVLSHPDNAGKLEAEGIDGVDALFGAYLVPGAKAFVPRTRPSSYDAIDLIHAAGGVAVWAHPFWDLDRDDETLRTVDRFAEARIDGVEVFYPSHTEAQTRLLHAPLHRARPAHHRLGRLPRPEQRPLQPLPGVRDLRPRAGARADRGRRLARRPGPARRLRPGPLRVGDGGIRRLLLGAAAVLGGDLAAGIDESLAGVARAHHEDRARPVAGADEDVVASTAGSGRSPTGAAGAPRPRRSGCTRRGGPGTPPGPPRGGTGSWACPGSTTWTLIPKCGNCAVSRFSKSQAWPTSSACAAASARLTTNQPSPSGTRPASVWARAVSATLPGSVMAPPIPRSACARADRRAPRRRAPRSR